MSIRILDDRKDFLPSPVFQPLSGEVVLGGGDVIDLFGAWIRPRPWAEKKRLNDGIVEQHNRFLEETEELVAAIFTASGEPWRSYHNGDYGALVSMQQVQLESDKHKTFFEQVLKTEWTPPHTHQEAAHMAVLAGTDNWTQASEVASKPLTFFLAYWLLGGLSSAEIMERLRDFKDIDWASFQVILYEASKDALAKSLITPSLLNQLHEITEDSLDALKRGLWWIDDGVVQMMSGVVQVPTLGRVIDMDTLVTARSIRLQHANYRTRMALDGFAFALVEAVYRRRVRRYAEAERDLIHQISEQMTKARIGDEVVIVLVRRAIRNEQPVIEEVGELLRQEFEDGKLGHRDGKLLTIDMGVVNARFRKLVADRLGQEVADGYEMDVKSLRELISEDTSIKIVTADQPSIRMALSDAANGPRHEDCELPEWSKNVALALHEVVKGYRWLRSKLAA